MELTECVLQLVEAVSGRAEKPFVVNAGRRLHAALWFEQGGPPQAGGHAIGRGTGDVDNIRIMYSGVTVAYHFKDQDLPGKLSETYEAYKALSDDGMNYKDAWEAAWRL